MSSKRTNKPTVRWRGDRWVNDGLDLMPCQVHVYGGFAEAARKKRDWMRDMSNQLYGLTVVPSSLPGTAEENREQALELHALAVRYDKWAVELEMQGL